MTPSFPIAPRGPRDFGVSGVNSIRIFSLERVQQPDSAHPYISVPDVQPLFANKK
jgi:hypothetical protein